MHNLCPFCKKKHAFLYFTHSFLQNTNISLSILHIYSIKYSKPSHHHPDQYIATISDQYLASIINPHNHHHQASLIINPPIKISTTINPINTHESKSSKPSHHQQLIPNPPSSTHTTTSLHHRPTYQNPSHHQLDQYPRIKIIKTH